MPDSTPITDPILTSLATARDWMLLIAFLAAYFGAGIACCWGIIAAIRSRK